jgi:putative Flp pilus-assembly TadE/G-like protein
LGQSIIIFALTLTVLLGFAGLAIDVARIYDLYARMQRAAEAGVLAGVLYMPTSYNSARPDDGLSAVSRALAETYKDGFGPAPLVAPDTAACPTPPAVVEVAVCQVPGKTNDLQVTITETTPLALLTALGIRPVTLVAAAQAEYLPPIQLGARLNFFGDEVECSATNPPDPLNTAACPYTTGSNHIQSFLATFKGPAENKERGDPYVYCEEGPSSLASAADLDGSTFPYTLYNGVTSNHVQWSSSAAAIQPHCGQPVAGGNPGNPDQQPTGYDGPATAGTTHPGGYNYEVVVPPTITGGASVWIYNPSFVPTDNAAGTDYFNFYPAANGMKDPFGNGVTYNGHQDAPPFYFSVTYTIYAITDLYDRTTDSQVTSVTYPPYDFFSVSANPGGSATSDGLTDLQSHGCAGSPTVAYDPYWLDYQNGTVNSTPNSYHNAGSVDDGGGKGCFDLNSSTPPSWHTSAPAPCWLKWCMLGAHLAPGTYRLVVEATGLVSNTADYRSGTTDGWGTHRYAVKVCPTSTIVDPIGNHCPTGATGSDPGVSIFGWNNMEASFATPLAVLTPSATDPTTSCAQTNASPYACLDLGCIQTAYAGRQVDIRLFDLGDGSGDLFAGVTPPSGSGATVTYPGFVPAGTVDGVAVVQTHFTMPRPYNELNGRWLDVTATLPPSYTGNCQTGAGGTGWWQLIYASATGGSPGDWLNVSFSLVGSPVHLVLPGA